MEKILMKMFLSKNVLISDSFYYNVLVEHSNLPFIEGVQEKGQRFLKQTFFLDTLYHALILVKAEILFMFYQLFIEIFTSKDTIHHLFNN